MHLTYGATRWVVLTNRYAIKIARFRPIRPFIRFFQLEKGGPKQNLKKYDANLMKALLKYIGAGVRANRIEYRLYKRYGKGNDLLVPTLFTIGWLVNVQRRGEPSREEDARRHQLWQILDNPQFTEAATDLQQAKQFCTIGSRVYLVDYGLEILEPVLAMYEMSFEKVNAC